MNVIRFLQRKTECSVLHDYKTVQQALRFMRDHGKQAMPMVNQDGFYLGVVREGDLLWHLLDCGGYEAVKDNTLGSFMEKYNIPALKITASDEELKHASMRCPFVPIVDDRDVFVGIVDSKDVTQYFVDQAMAARVVVTA